MIANIQQKEIYDVFSAQVQVLKAVFEQNIQPPLLAIDESVWIGAAIRHRHRLLLCLVPCTVGLHGTGIGGGRPHTGGEVHHGGAIVRP